MAIKNIWWVIVLGLFLRLLIAAFSYHPDLQIINFSSAIILKEHNLSPYNFLNSLNVDDPRKLVYAREIPDDLPLQYWIRIPFEVLIRPLVNGDTEHQFFLDASTLLGNTAFYWHLIIIKLPLIIFDLMAGLLLALTLAPYLRKRVLLLWVVNPVSLWATAAIGQVDILPTFFVILAFFLLKRGKTGQASLSLGIGGALKSFPFLLAPFIILSGRTWMERLKLTILTLVPLLLTIVPYLNSPEFRHQALFAPQLDKMFFAQISLSGGESVSVTIAILTILYLLFTLRPHLDLAEEFKRFSLSALLLILSFTHFHIQWFLWVTPFLILLISRGLKFAEALAIFLIFLSLIMMLFLFESSLQLQLFAPLFPNLSGVMSITDIIGNEKATFYKDMAASVFAGASMFLSYYLLSKSNQEG